MHKYLDQDRSVEELLREAFPPTPTRAWERQIREDLLRLRGASADPEALYRRLLLWQPPGTDVTMRPYYRAEDREQLEAPILPPAPSPSWVIRQDFSRGSLEAARDAALEARRGGAEAVGFRLDLGGPPAGLPIRNGTDFGHLLEGLSFTEGELHLDADAAPSAVLALWLNEADRRETNPGALRGSIGFDPLRRLQVVGRADPEAAYREAADLLRWGAAHAPRLRLLRADLQPYAEAGASAVQELSCGLGLVSEHLARLQRLGLGAEAVLPRLQLTAAVGTSFFLEIAKLRALRLLLPRVAQAYAPDLPPGAAPPHLHAVTSRWDQARYAPYNNLLRGTTAAAAAVLGGCDLLTVRPFDEVLDGPDPTSYRLARNTQLLLRHEAHLDRVADPAGGAYYLEQLTDTLARKAWETFQKLEAQGGLLAALRAGTVQEEIAAVRHTRREAVALRRRVYVGVNQYPNPEEHRLDELPETVPAGTVPSAQAYLQASDLDILRQQLRDGTAVGDLPQRAREEEEEGEASISPLPSERGPAEVEQLRLRTERWRRAQGHTPTVLLVPAGDPAARSTRANFARNFFGCAGFRIVEPDGFSSVEEGLEAAEEVRPELLVVCSADEAYPEFVPAIARGLARRGLQPLIVVAGYPEPDLERLREGGAHSFVHFRSNLVETLRMYQHELGL